MFEYSLAILRRLLPVGVLFACILGLISIPPATAQEQEKTIGDATLQLWPEYDDPGLLVIYSGEFTDTVQFPQQVAFPILEGARGIQATSAETDGQLINQQWQVVDGKLVYTLPGPGFHIEYYVDRPPSGDQREISHTFETPYAVDSLNIRVQQPARATDFSMMPPADTSIIENDGLTYSLINKADLKPGDQVGFTIRYKKTDQGFSRPAGAANQNTPTPQFSNSQGAAPESRFNSWLPYLLIGVGLLALAGAGLYWILRVRVSPASEPAGRDSRSRGPTSPAISAQKGNDELAFCTHCGRQFGAEDKFCANCGAPRRG
jgi:hypothetical protein